MNLTSIAKLAGVSVSTVSKAFSGSSEISTETKERIFQVARQTGCFDKYTKNKYAKKVIAVIYPEMASDYYTSIVNKLDHFISETGAVLVSSATNFDKERESELFTYYSAYAKVDGIIMVDMRNKPDNRINTPFVSLSTAARHSFADAIHNDLYSAIEEAIQYLQSLGHVNIGFASEKLTVQKLEYYKTAMRKAGLAVRPANFKISEKRFEEAGIEMMNEWLDNSYAPTAIIAAYDYIAIGLTKSIYQHGLRIPDDFSIIGMDDISAVSHTNTAISSIRTNTEKACLSAVELLMKKIDNPHYTSRDYISIPAELVIRESVGPAKHSK